MAGCTNQEYTLDETISRDTRDCLRGREVSRTAFGALLRIEAKKSSFVTATEWFWRPVGPCINRSIQFALTAGPMGVKGCVLKRHTKGPTSTRESMSFASSSFRRFSTRLCTCGEGDASIAPRIDSTWCHLCSMAWMYPFGGPRL